MPETPTTVPHGFSSRSLPWKLHSYEDAIERRLAGEVERAGGRRPFVVTSKSIAEKTGTLTRAEKALGSRLAGSYAGIENDSTYRSVKEATDAARRAGADLLVAVGGGSLIVAVRAINIFLCEHADPFQLMTQYPEGKPAFSPKLNSPKLPTINVVTTPTSAMNRAGTGLKNEDLDHRMEYYDPKTRPCALLWDWQALRETPFAIIRSTAATTFAGSLGATLRDEPNPLVEADRDQVFRLANRSFRDLATQPDEIGPRLGLCASAFLANRAEDDRSGGLMSSQGERFLGDYAVSSALHVRYPHVGQGESTSVLSATTVRRAEVAPLELAVRAAKSLGVWHASMDGKAARMAVADELERMYTAVGMPTRVEELGIPRNELRAVAEQTVKNFNANPGSRSVEDQIRRALELLEAAW